MPTGMVSFPLAGRTALSESGRARMVPISHSFSARSETSHVKMVEGFKAKSESEEEVDLKEVICHASLPKSRGLLNGH